MPGCHNFTGHVWYCDMKATTLKHHICLTSHVLKTNKYWSDPALTWHNLIHSLHQSVSISRSLSIAAGMIGYLYYCLKLICLLLVQCTDVACCNVPQGTNINWRQGLWVNYKTDYCHLRRYSDSNGKTALGLTLTFSFIFHNKSFQHVRGALLSKESLRKVETSSPNKTSQQQCRHAA